MPYLSEQEMSKAREMDLLTYMQRYEPDNLINCKYGVYRLEEHGSLVISNGNWNWFKIGKYGGVSTLDYMVKVRGMSYYDAALFMLNLEGKILPERPTSPRTWTEQKEKPKRPFALPPAHVNNDQAAAYLMYRLIGKEIINYCIEAGIVYESVRGSYHNCVFVGHDENGEARFAAQRGIGSHFKRDVTGSDKRYNFVLHPDKAADCLCVFESAIDALSYATLIHKANPDAWKGARCLSLGGVSTLALEQYLKTHPGIREIALRAALCRSIRPAKPKNAGRGSAQRPAGVYRSRWPGRWPLPHTSSQRQAACHYTLP